MGQKETDVGRRIISAASGVCVQDVRCPTKRDDRSVIVVERDEKVSACTCTCTAGGTRICRRRVEAIVVAFAATATATATAIAAQPEHHGQVVEADEEHHTRRKEHNNSQARVPLLHLQVAQATQADAFPLMMLNTQIRRRFVYAILSV